MPATAKPYWFIEIRREGETCYAWEDSAGLVASGSRETITREVIEAAHAAGVETVYTGSGRYEVARCVAAYTERA